MTSDDPGFVGVPPMMIQCSHYAFHNATVMDGSVPETKMGSLQKFVECESSCKDTGFANLPVHEVNKITVLDIRMENVDRHGRNILICNEFESLFIIFVPINHGYCLLKEICYICLVFQHNTFDTFQVCYIVQISL